MLAAEPRRLARIDRHANRPADTALRPRRTRQRGVGLRCLPAPRGPPRRAGVGHGGAHPTRGGGWHVSPSLEHGDRRNTPARRHRHRGSRREERTREYADLGASTTTRSSPYPAAREDAEPLATRQDPLANTPSQASDAADV